VQAEALDTHPSTNLRPHAAILLRGNMLGVGAFRRLAIGSGSRHCGRRSPVNHVVYSRGKDEYPADPYHRAIPRLPQQPYRFQAFTLPKHGGLQRVVSTSGRILRRRGKEVKED
jgi:hypothetical protein